MTVGIAYTYVYVHNVHFLCFLALYDSMFL